MRFLPALLAAAILTLSTRASGPSQPDTYEILIGQDLNGSGFVIRHNEVLYAVASLHQFEGKQPEHFIDIEFKEIEVDTDTVFTQEDIQALKLADQESVLPHLDYDPNFSIAPGEAIIILGPAGDLVNATVTQQEAVDDEPYESSQGSQTIEFVTDQPFLAAGGSGCPVIRKSTGSVSGVLLAADDANAAKRGTFETLCLGMIPRPTLAREVKAIAQVLPHGNDWLEEGGKVESLGWFWELVLKKGEVDRAKKSFVGGHSYNFNAQLKLDFSSLFVASFDDKAIAAGLPKKLEIAVDFQVSLLKRDYEIDAVSVTNPKVANMDSTSLIRINGRDLKNRSAFNQTTLRVSRNTNYVEIILRNGDLSDQQLFATAESLLQAVEKFGVSSPSTP